MVIFLLFLFRSIDLHLFFTFSLVGYSYEHNLQWTNKNFWTIPPINHYWCDPVNNVIYTIQSNILKSISIPTLIIDICLFKYERTKFSVKKSLKTQSCIWDQKHSKTHLKFRSRLEHKITTQVKHSKL